MSTPTLQARVASTPQLEQLAHDAHQAGLSRVLSDELRARLDPDGMHVLKPLLVHDDADPDRDPVRRPAHVRCYALIKLSDQEVDDTPVPVVFLDVALRPFRELPAPDEW
ncbi:hypothetical protein ER308_04520 [Egibacter rhizosphaerae]|uniref:Uncharacterized protein n=1 Tax=Egibacter rhizosphaerae TaxID=1670831 RepID=A0A411YCF5_9ACTN|nr:hypothetical protein [Egibacter rhizosphaerae]QBI18880.1 hypothetical protein ER308_04520 [Egibacter rhizosphaerae]